MATIYTTPGVYVEKVGAVSRNFGEPSSFIGAFVGEAQRGKVKTPTQLTSWNEYIEKFALGMTSPFLSTSLLAYAVYGFFQNGGTQCYVSRAAGAGYKAATLSIATKTGVLNAKDEGAWGNNLKVTIDANGTDFDVIVKLGTEEVERFVALSTTESSGKYWAKHINDNSQYLSAVSGSIGVMAETSLATGSDGASIADADIYGADSALQAYDKVQFSDVVGMSVPMKFTSALASAVVMYCESRTSMFAVLDTPEVATIAEAITFRTAVASQFAATYYPWIKVVNPLSPVGALMNCPPSGHILGVYATMFANIGPWRAPAGTSAMIRGAVDLVVNLSDANAGILNVNNINAIVSKPNYGIVIWGARSLSTEGNAGLFYITDSLLYLYIKQSLHNLTLPYVFEPNGEVTWGNITATVEAFLYPVWEKGGLKGKTAEEAYFVKCDASTNTPTTIAQGKLICEVGYAANKPAEFIIFRISHTLANN